MTIEVLKQAFTVCKVRDVSAIDLSDEFVFVGKTDNELSLVCVSDRAPQNTLKREDGWRAMRVVGALDFSLIGILKSITTLLARREISVFAVSTYDTDYVLVKEERLDRAVEALKEQYQII